MSAVQVLKDLIQKHFFVSDEGGLEWRYYPGVTLSEVDSELAAEIDRLMNLGKDDKPV